MVRPSAALCVLLLAVGCSKNPAESGTFGNGSDPGGSDDEGSGSSDTDVGSSTSTSTSTTSGGDDSTSADVSEDDGSSSTGATCETPTVFYADTDGDGFGDPTVSVEACEAPPDHVDNADDCDDTDENANPDIVEVCDGVDNDCDSLLDEYSAENELCSQCELAPFGDSIYWFCGSADVTWTAARQSCEAFGATLTSVHSLQEQGFIVDHLGSSVNQWIGCSDAVSEGNFAWVDGTAFDYDNWVPDEEPSGGSGQHCCELDAQRSMQWNDNFCSRTRGFACKAPAGD